MSGGPVQRAGAASYPVLQHVRRQSEHPESGIPKLGDLIVDQVLRQHTGGHALRQRPLPVPVPAFAALVGEQVGGGAAQRLHPVELFVQRLRRGGAFVQTGFHFLNA